MKIAFAWLALLALATFSPVAAQVTEGAVAGGYDETITGIVVSQTADTLVLSTAAGERRFEISRLTTKPAELPVDSAVTVTYRNDGGRLLAGSVELSPVASSSSTATRPTDPPTAPASSDASAPRSLPATASRIPQLALLGGLALGAALILRRFS